MDYRNKNKKDAWDDGVFGTGNTMPPKSYSSLIAILIILVIFLSGIVSLLSFMNIKLFQELSQQKKKEHLDSPMSFSGTDSHAAASLPSVTDPTEPAHIQGDLSLRLHGSPQSVENIPEPGAMSWQEIYEKNIPSVVSILSTTQDDTQSGTGIILSEQGYIVTTACILKDTQSITISLPDGRRCGASVVGTDPVTDLAVIFTDADNLMPAEFGDSEALRVGDPVGALGDPLGINLSASLIDGIISGINRDVRFLGKDISLIQTTVSMSSCNSGGPLVNCYGQVIGINTTHIAGNEVSDRIGFAIPSATVKHIVDQLIAHGYVSGRPTLGLSGDAVTRFDQYYFHIPQGLYIDCVDPHSDAHFQGIVPGDILMRLNGEAIVDQLQLDILVNSLEIGDTVEAVFFINGQERSITLTVTEYTG